MRWIPSLIAAVLLTHNAAAQANTVSLAASANVVTVGMTLTPLRDLGFGSVLKGVATSVLPTAATAGEWQVSGSPNAFVSIALTLPTQLTNIQAVPGITMPISFNNTSARWRRAVNNPVGANVFNPSVGTTGRFGPSPNPNLYIWIGGTVNPPLSQLPGIYTGNIIVTLNYL